MSMRNVMKTSVIGMVVWCATCMAAAQTPLQPPNQEYDAAVRLFLDAKDSGNPRLDYRDGLDAFGKIVESAKDDDLRMRCHYFLAFSHFLLRDYVRAGQEAEKVAELAPAAYPEGGRIKYEADIVSAVQEGSASLNQALIALTANEMKSAAAFGKSLGKYFDKTKGAANEEMVAQTATTITVLAALSPVFCPEGNLAEEKTAQSLCQDNMRRIIKGWLAYVKEHKDQLPPICLTVNNTGSSYHDRAEWPTIIGKYLPDPDLQKAKFDAPASAVRIMPGSVMQCPAAPAWLNGYTSSYLVDYGMNHAVPAAAKTLGQINNPGELVVFVDSDNSFAGPDWGYGYIQCRHSGGANVAFADGRVDWKSKAELPNAKDSPIWQPRLGPARKVALDLDDQAVGAPVSTQPVAGVISKPTYVSQGEGLAAKVEDVPALKGKALLIGDNSEPLSQNIAFSIDAIKTGKYGAAFDYCPVKCGASHIAVFDVRNSAQKQIFTLAMHANKSDLSIIIDGKTFPFNKALNPDDPAHFDLTIDLGSWSYQLSVNGGKLSDGALNSVADHDLVGMVFWTPGVSEFAIKNLVADVIK